jgi:thiamine biosynthesis lipoprotein ApbE
MDLPTVKAAVKAWEKRFKAEHSRDPTKDDIKRDTSDIGQY